MRNSNTHVRAADSNSTNKFPWHWSLTELPQPTCGTVFTTFSCGGGSSMGYKRAGFDVIGNVEIDPAMADMYRRNHHPRYSYNMDLRKFNEIPNADLPAELFDLDILDGSPPCTTFSMAGKREATWGKEKQFREGQKKQTLDDLFFVFLDTVDKLRPKVVIAENVTGILQGNAKGYVNAVINRFREIGYELQIFSMNTAYMDVPQARHRAFFVANRMGYPKLKLSFHHKPIRFGEVKSAQGRPCPADSKIAYLVKDIRPGDRTLENAYYRLTGKKGSYFNCCILQDANVAPAITSGGAFFRGDKTYVADDDFVAVQSFPYDYDFCGNSVQYVTGMSVPPNAMANIASEVYEQWLK